jgi:hypothetical protein
MYCTLKNWQKLIQLRILARPKLAAKWRERPVLAADLRGFHESERTSGIDAYLALELIRVCPRKSAASGSDA